jgi:hypothetical protein
MRCAIVAAFALLACKQSKPVPAASPEGIPKGDTVAVAAPTASKYERVPPAKQVAWTRPTRTPSDQEQLLAGTWVATVGEYATRSAFMADRVVFGLDAKAGGDLVDAVTKAIAADNKVQTNCIWLELRPDFTGFRRECMLVNGSPSALDQNDPMSGAKKDLGTRFEWFSDASDRNAIKIRFADDMVVPAAGPSGVRQLVFRHWTLRLSAGAGDGGIAITESFPEHDYTLPTTYSYVIKSGAYLDP